MNQTKQKINITLKVLKYIIKYIIVKKSMLWLLPVVTGCLDFAFIMGQ